MARFRIRGLDAGLVRVSQDGRVAEARNDREVGIYPSRRSGFAPCGVVFDTEVVWPGVDRPRKELRYDWRFDADGVDGGPGTFAALTERSTALGWNDRRVAFGPSATHAFLAPGTYRVRVTVTDGVDSVVAETRVEVADPDVQFSRSNSVFVAADGDFAGAPSGARWVTTVAEAGAAWRNAGRDGRILFKAGQTFDTDGVGFEDVNRLLIGAWGEGPKPVLTATAPGGLRAILGMKDDLGETAVSGVEIVGGWNAATTSGDDPNGIVIYATGGHCTLHDLYIHGVSHGVNVNRSEGNGGGGLNLVMSDFSITDWSNYGFFIMYGHRMGIVGGRIDQNVDALGNGTGKFDGRNDHSSGRLAQLDTNRDAPAVAVFSCLENLALNGWTSALDGRGIERPAHNTALRFNTDGRNGLRGMFDRIIAEGGRIVMSMGCQTNRGENGPYISAYMDTILDKAVLLGTGNTVALLAISHAGVTTRNVLGILPPQVSEIRPAYAFLADIGGTPPARQDYGNEFYSNTFLSWTDGEANDPDPGDTWDPLLVNDGHAGKFGFFVAANNAVHGPRWGTPVVSDLDLTERLFAPYYKGLRWEGENDGALDPSYATPDHFDLDGRQQATVVLPRPVSGGAEYRTALGGAVALDDITGALRGPVPSQGSVE